MADTSEQPTIVARGRGRKRIGLAIAAVIVALGAVIVVSRHSAQSGTEPLIPVEPGALAGWNVLLVSIDTVRADHLGCYGYSAGATPTLDALAAGGVRCEQAIASAPITLPSHASLVTGLYPHRHGARTNGLFHLPEKIVTLAEVLRTRGYRTGAVVSAYVLDARYGLGQGFDDYIDDLSAGHQGGKFGYREIRAERASASALRWLRKGGPQPFFLFVHYFDPHAPYDSPEPYKSRFAERPYDGEIAYADEQLGGLLAALDELDLARRTLVVAVSDHGESLGEHGERTHTIMIYDATLRVPWVMRAPGVLPAGSVVHRQVGLVDVMPTILDLLGEAIPEGLDGVSLLRPAVAAPRELYIETLAPKLQFGWAPLMGIRRDNVKFILAPRPELYDLSSDPNELVNLFASRRDVAERLHERLRAIVGGDPELTAMASGNLPLDVASRKKLQGLGYIFQPGAGATTRQSLPDPKDMMGEWVKIQQAQGLAESGKHAEAVAMLEELLRDQPNNWRAWQTLGLSYKALGQVDRAVEAFRKEAQNNYRAAEATARMAGALLELGRLDEAEASYKGVLTDDPNMAMAVYGLAGVRVKQDRPDEAMKLYRRYVALGDGEEKAAAWFNIGALHHAAGRKQEARDAFQQSLRVDPNYGRSVRALAEMMRQDGRRTEALALLEQSAARQPEVETLVALGELQGETGQLGQGAETLRRAIELRPDLPAVHRHLAGVLQRLGQHDQAAKHVGEWVRLSPNDPQARAQLGVALAGQKRFAEAETHLRRATELAPKWSRGHYNLGVVLAMQEKLKAAAASFRQAVQLEPEYATAHNALGQVLMSLGRADEAAEHFRKALSIDPKMSAARENLQNATSAPATSRRAPTSTRGSR